MMFGWVWLLWPVGVLGACIFCLVRAAVDFRAGKYVWAALGLASATIIMLTPIPTHAVKIDLPRAD